MVLFVNLLLFIASCLVLVFAGAILVKTLPIIARVFRMSEFVLSFVLMAISTSLPELFIGITSANEGNSALALGTVIGSNIANLTLVGGMAIILARGFKSEPESKKSAWFMFFLVILPVLLMFLGQSLSRVDGLILLIVFAVYMVFLLSKGRNHILKEKVSTGKFIVCVLLFMFSLILLFQAAKYAVKYASLLAFDMLMPPILIGLFFLAIGTSLPELVFESIAARTKKTELALGDLLGSVIINSTLVLGVTAVIQPITANFILYLTSSVFMIAVTFLFVVFLDTGKQLTWKEGMALVIFYVLFLLIELNIPRTLMM